MAAILPDEKGGNYCPEKYDGGLWYLRTAKLAVAVAIIKSRPKGRTGREHAEFLASRLHCEDNDWKAKAQGLQEEVLRLRQELLLSKARAEIMGSSVAGDPSMDGRCQATEESLWSSAPWEGDSGFGTGSSMEVLPLSAYAEVPQASHCSLPPAPSFSALPSERSCAGSHGRSMEIAMLHHTQFLHSLVGLGQAADSRDGPVVRDALCQLLSCMVEAWADPRLLPPASLILRAARVVGQALESLSGPACGELVGRAESCLKELTALLLDNTRLNWFQRQETLADCLAALGGSPSLKLPFILHAFCEVNAFGEHLLQSLGEGLGQFDVARYENCFYLLRVLERLLLDESWEQSRVFVPGGGRIHCPPSQQAKPT
ncbi:meiosis-specific protein MEI4 isoform X2 [Brienomyrus brachyistius]|uniref:meiosis-specific protein MEI4 isoform X2 n=1 Tax=Brienomyrus brachyistius TaxID=42636 RepID=UPI0020B3CE1A|nr:meiosis-specific protein MEI4 isoform X2 [Brienomyrus brachyistius]